MEQLTIRGFEEELELHIRKLARSQGISLNQAVLRLLRKGAGLIERKDTPDVVGSSLDHFIGTWSSKEADEIKSAISDFEEIDETMWK